MRGNDLQQATRWSYISPEETRAARSPAPGG